MDFHGISIHVKKLRHADIGTYSDGHESRDAHGAEGQNDGPQNVGTKSLTDGLLTLMTLIRTSLSIHDISNSDGLINSCSDPFAFLVPSMFLY